MSSNNKATKRYLTWQVRDLVKKRLQKAMLLSFFVNFFPDHNDHLVIMLARCRARPAFAPWRLSQRNFGVSKAMALIALRGNASGCIRLLWKQWLLYHGDIIICHR